MSNLLGHPTVKVFNNTVARQLPDRCTPAGTEGRRALPVAGDDRDIRSAVLGPVDA